MYETRVLEKECEVRLARSEAASYKLAAQARITAVNTLKLAVASLLQDKEHFNARIKELEDAKGGQISAGQEQLAIAALSSARAALSSKTDALKHTQQALQTANTAYTKLLQTATRLEERQAPIAELQKQFKAVQLDAATAAEQLMEACEDNEQLADALERASRRALHAENELRESNQREEELQEALGHMAEEAAELKHALEAAETEVAGLRRLVKSQQQSVSSSTSTALVATTTTVKPPETDSDVLEELEWLRRENTELRAAVEQSENEAMAAKRELRQLHTNADSLHLQLSDVISGLSAASPGPPLSGGRRDDDAASVGGHNNNNNSNSVIPAIGIVPTTNNNNNTANTTTATSITTAAAAAAATATKSMASAPLRKPTWRGPTTPTSNGPPIASTALLHGGRGGSDSESVESTALLAELRHAMHALDNNGGGGV